MTVNCGKQKLCDAKTVQVHAKHTLKQLKYVFVALDLSLRACGWVARNTLLGIQPHAIFLVTPLQAHTNKYDLKFVVLL